MSVNATLQSPQATPRPALVSLPSAGGAPRTAQPQDQSRKKAREDRLLQFAEEERIEDERAVRKLLSHVVALPFDTAIEYHDLDGLLHMAAPPAPFVRHFLEREETVQAPMSPPRSPFMSQNVPPLAHDAATVRGHISRRYHPLGTFAVPKSPRLSGQRPSARRRVSERGTYRSSANLSSV